MDARRAWIGGLTVALLAHAASAAVTRVALVVVPTEEGAERAALELERALTESLAKDPRLAIIDPVERYAPQAAERTARQLEAGKAALEAVKASVGRLEYPEARQRAEAALAELRAPDFRALKGVVLELLLHLAAIKHALEVADRGTAELTQALLLDSKLTVPREWNSQEKAWFAQTRQLVTAAPPRTVRLERDGPPGWVWVDGQLVGLTPVTLSDVRPGRHFFTFVAPGVEEHPSELLGDLERVTFAPSESSEGRSYRALRAALASGFRQGEPTAAAAELMTWCKVDEVLAVAVGGTVGARVFRSGAAGRVPVTEAAVASPAMVAEVVRLALDRKLEPPVAPPSPPAPQEAARSKAPGVVLLAVAAAAVVAGAVLVKVSRDAYSQTGKIAQVETAPYDQAVNHANTLLGSGIGAFGGAVAFGGAGVVLLVW